MVSEPLDQVPGPYEDTTCQMVAAYGKSDHPHLETIREFRDTVLKGNRAGRVIVNAYYSTTATASIVERSRFLRAAVRYALAYPAYGIARAGIGLSEGN